jgi:hypothetical protein
MSSKETSNDKIRQEKIQVWLKEYEVCHCARNHFDTIRWTIGSIFLVVSFALLGLSFQKDIAGDPPMITLITFFSVFPVVIWLLYDRLLQPYIDSCYERIWKIEEELRAQGMDIWLNTNMKQDFPKGRGKRILYLATSLILAIAILRIMFAWL